MNESYVTIQGRLVADPDLKQTRTGTTFAAFRVASTVRRPAPGGAGAYQDGPTSFFNVSAFRSLGANVAHSLHKGEPVTVYGRLRVNQFVRGDGSQGTTAEIDAYAVGHDLSYGTSAFAKVSRAQYDESDRLADPNIQQAFDAQTDAGAAASGAGGGEGRGAGLGDPETDPYEVAGGPATGAGGNGEAAPEATASASDKAEHAA